MPTKKIYQNTLAQIAGKLATAVISILLIKILTNYLDVEGYGLYSKIYNYLSIFAVIADLGLYTITVREIAENKDDPKKVEHILGNTLTLRAGMGIIIILLSLGLAYFLPGYNTSMALIGIGITGVFTLFGLLNSSIMTYLQAMLQTERSAIANIGGKLLTVGLIALFAFIVAPVGYSTDLTRYTLVMIAGLVGNIWMTWYNYSYARKLIKISFHFDPSFIADIIKKSLPYGIALFFNVIFFKIDVILISMLEEIHTADISIALYSLPMKIVEVGMMYSTIFLNSLLPELSGSLKRKDATHTPLLEKGYKLLFFFGLGISTFLFTFPKEVLSLISSEKFVQTLSMGYGSVDAMIIVCWIFFLYFLSSIGTYTMVARKKEKAMIWINAIVALINILGNLLLIPHYSFFGAAIATLISQILLFIMVSYSIRFDLPLRPLIPFSLYTIGLAILSYTICTLFSIGLIFGIAVFVIVYLGGEFLYIRLLKIYG